DREAACAHEHADHALGPILLPDGLERDGHTGTGPQKHESHYQVKDHHGEQTPVPSRRRRNQLTTRTLDLPRHTGTVLLGCAVLLGDTVLPRVTELRRITVLRRVIVLRVAVSVATKGVVRLVRRLMLAHAHTVLGASDRLVFHALRSRSPA